MTVATQAGTGCHEGGIILNKKPPEWRPVPAGARGQTQAQSPRRCPWSESGQITPPLPVISLVPHLPAAARGQTLKVFFGTATKDSPLGKKFQNNFELFKLKLGILKFILIFAEEF